MPYLVMERADSRALVWESRKCAEKERFPRICHLSASIGRRFGGREGEGLSVAETIQVRLGLGFWKGVEVEVL